MDHRGWSAPTPGQYTCILQKYSKIFFSEATWPIKAKFYREHLWEGGINVFINNPGHMIKMDHCKLLLFSCLFPTHVSSPEPLGSQGELIGWS